MSTGSNNRGKSDSGYLNNARESDRLANTDPLSDSLGQNAQVPTNTSSDPQADTTDEGGYGTNQYGDSFSNANQAGAADQAPNKAGQFQ